MLLRPVSTWDSLESLEESVSSLPSLRIGSLLPQLSDVCPQNYLRPQETSQPTVRRRPVDFYLFLFGGWPLVSGNTGMTCHADKRSKSRRIQRQQEGPVLLRFFLASLMRLVRRSASVLPLSSIHRWSIVNRCGPYQLAQKHYVLLYLKSQSKWSAWKAFANSSPSITPFRSALFVAAIVVKNKIMCSR